MNNFIIAGKEGFIQIELNEVYGFPNETSYLGGYDVKGKIDIKSGNYYVKDAEIWFSTGQVYQFFIRLKKCYNELKGSVTFLESENNLKIELNFNRLGQINIQGYFQEVAHQENILHYEFESEQSYLTSTLRQLNSIVDEYGDLKGEK
ncbi:MULTISPECIES: hypothetical protein [unclassified Bacillus (in: firmicutes)]|uniref:WapI family immunity protein n=1 Tax=unclassified Bacillus (in: firmicutes) TaxID=185979 RepID=UPI0008E487DE|nr:MULTISPECIES: hypothetical protein [unclassified Bacillus (in: firmicutes)]SFA85167.1 hypothetical protein SAMN02799634_1023 [Bacillus sp. UNCCL13]SFQ83287.1 hypothetical protein SAMN04488577_2123 [Bacillus sp. cl95]